MTASGKKSRWKTYAAGFGALAMVVLLGACGLFLDEQAQIKRALEAQQRGDLRAASIDLKGVLEKNPQNATARYHLGRISLSQGDAVSAVREFERAGEAGYPASALAEVMARAYLATGQNEQALKVIDERLKSTDSAGPAATGSGNTGAAAARISLLRLRGESLAALNRTTEARAAFDDALALASDDVSTLLALTNLVARTDGPAAALAVTDRALAAAPKNASVRRTRGGLYLAAQQPQLAIAEFQSAVAEGGAKAEQVLSLSGLAQSELAAGKVKEALITTEQLQKLAADAPMARYLRAYALVQDGQFDPARLLLEQNVVNETDVPSRILLGAVNLAQGRLGQAEMYLASAVAAAPDNTVARQLLAEARLRQSKPADALEALAPAVDGEAANANLLALAARASIASGDTQQGVAYLKRNSTANPQDLNAKMDLAAGYLAAGLPEKAMAELDQISAAKANSNQGDSSLTQEQQLRRDYLDVLARIKAGDRSGAAAHAARRADAQPKSVQLQALASSVYAMQGQFVQARKYGQAAIRLQPEMAAGYVLMGRIDLMQGESDRAAANFRLAIAKEPGNLAANSALALIELAAKRPNAAIEVIDSALKHVPDQVELRILKAQTLLSIGKPEEAEKLARDTVALAGSNPSAWGLLGRVLSVRGKHTEAIESFRRAVLAAPASAQIRQQFAVAYRAAGNQEQALATVNEALRLDEKYLPSVELAARLNLAAGDLDAATKHVDVLLKTAPEQATTHELLGELRFAQKRYKDAEVALQKAWKIAPSGGIAIGMYTVRKRADIADAIELVAQYHAAHPDDVTTGLVLADDYQLRGDRKLAIQGYENIIAQQPANAVALNNLAWLRFEDGDRRAMDLAQRAHQAAPKSKEVADTYAWIQVNSGKEVEGLKLLETIVTSKTTSSQSALPTEIIAHYAIALSRNGRVADARRVAGELEDSQVGALDSKLRELLAPLLKSG